MEDQQPGTAAPRPAVSPPPASPRPEPLRALDVDGIGVILVGTVVFAALAVATLIDRNRLHAEGHGWWVGVTLVGVALGLLALGYAIRRRHRRYGVGDVATPPADSPTR